MPDFLVPIAAGVLASILVAAGIGKLATETTRSKHPGWSPFLNEAKGLSPEIYKNTKSSVEKNPEH